MKTLRKHCMAAGRFTALSIRRIIFAMTSESLPVPFLQDSLHALHPQARYPKSPLRYPGGKARAVQLLLRFIPRDTQRLVSPFLGGGSLEIAAAWLGVEVIGYDVFQPLVDFWQLLLSDPQALAEAAASYYPLAKDAFYSLQKSVCQSTLESAAVFYVLNRASFGGATLSGGMSPGHPRFTTSSIEYLRAFRAPNLQVHAQDFHTSIRAHADALLYLDPPYLIGSSLYGKKGDTHKDFDHEGLCQVLRARGQWLLSYNDCDEIRDLYGAYRMLTPQWKYGMSNDKQSRELLILSDDLPEICYPGQAIQPNLF